MGTGRLEAFSDGVIAVAITLLVLGISVPDPGRGSPLGQIGHRWPEFAAYVTSFLTIGIIWINHHAMIGRLRGVDRTILLLNLLLLMSVVVLPFATELMAAYLRARRGEDVSAAIYSGAFLIMSIFFVSLNRVILLRRADLHVHPLSLEQRRTILQRNVVGVVPYTAATGLAFVSPYITLGICAALVAYYATSPGSGTEARAGDP